MAEALFDSHPLEEYFEQFSDGACGVMPGSLQDLVENDDNEDAYETDEIVDVLQQISLFIQPVLNGITSAMATGRPEKEFAERFKYIVISSSLLSRTLASLSPPSATPSQISFTLPGRFNHPLPDPFRAPNNHHLPFFSPLTFFSLAILFLTLDYYIWSTLAFMAFKITDALDTSTSEQATQTLDSLRSLTDAAHAWDTAAGEIMSIIDAQERSPFYSPLSSTLSGLRLTMQSTLDTSQTQCDHIRQLFSSLTSPLELNMLSEMYAPTSTPNKLSSSAGGSLRDSLRSKRGDIPSPPTSPTHPPSSSRSEKRSTWSGASNQRRVPVLSRSPLSKSLRQESALRHRPIRKLSVSTPASPARSPHRPVLDIESEDVVEPFGVSALKFQSARKTSGRSRKALSTSYNPSARSPPPSHLDMHFSHSESSPSMMSSPSLSTRFTSLRSSRSNPSLSISSLRHAVQSTLASRRYCASHLLALRFEDEDSDETYWEDVRSVVGLLTSALEDAAVRIRDGLQDYHGQPDSALLSPIPSPIPPSPSLPSADINMESISFAPMPSHLSKAISHLNAVSYALDAAKVQLQECISSLQRGDGPSLTSEDSDAERDHPVMESFHALRNNIGLALRECERGRLPLQDVIRPPIDNSLPPSPELPSPSSSNPGGQDDRRASLSSDASSTSSHRHRADTPADEGPHALVDDDVTAHLLLTSSAQHLPPPGLEQVYEAMSSEPTFHRERSKLSREERIRLVKEQRASGNRLSLPRTPSSSDGGAIGGYQEVWGPGGEVVQELKDIISLVGERRRKMTLQTCVETPSSKEVNLTEGRLTALPSISRPPRPSRPLPRVPPSH